jgi:hypothetical protein
LSTSPAGERAPWKAVALPAEHGGWGLTLEPVLLGLLIVRSWAGLALGVAAFAAFVVRTPAKLVMVDRRRGRWLARTTLAARIAGVELIVLVGLAVFATVIGDARWWIALMVAAPFVAVESWFDVRSRSRRLVPEVCGAVGVAGAAAAIALAGGGALRLAVGAWIVLAARSIGAIAFVRAQIARLRHHDTATGLSDGAQLVAVGVAATATLMEHRLIGAAVVIVIVAAGQAFWSRHDPPAVTTIGIRQMLLGLAVVLAAAVGVWVG